MLQRLLALAFLGTLSLSAGMCLHGCSASEGVSKASADQAAVVTEAQPAPLPGQAQGENAAKIKEVRVAVTGMTWPVGWPARVRKALETLPWVRKVQVDFAKQQAMVAAVPEKYDEKELLQTLKKAGFGGKVVK